MDVIRGRAWKFGNDIDTDVIISSRYLSLPEPEQWGAHVMEAIAPEFAAQVKKGDILIAGENFGCGSSREHAALALKTVGIGAVVAGSLARIFFRNAINNGFPALECPGISTQVEQGDMIEVNLTGGQVRDITTGKVFQFIPLPDFIMEMLSKGGLVAYLSAKSA